MDLQNDTLSNLIVTVDDAVPKSVLYSRNDRANWSYGYDANYDIVIISKDGTLGEVVEISGLRIGLPKKPKYVHKRMSEKKNQFWERKEYPKDLERIPTIFQWNEKNADFKNLWVDYIDKEFERREQGYWFYNNGKPTYITGSHYMYLQWTRIDVGYPEYREANRALFLFWEACKADDRSYGMVYLKIRRSGFSFMASSDAVNIATLTRDARIGILSKTGPDAKKMFTDKVVPISLNYPFFFKPLQDGMDRPKTELAYRVPAGRITRKNMNEVMEDTMEGLDTTIDWKNTGDNSYDGEKLKLLIHDESGKWEKPENILNNWKVTKTCLRLGRKVVGKCMMGSTVNALNKGGANFKKLYNQSDVRKRNANGQTESGLYALYIPMEWNFEGFIDKYGMPVMNKPDEPTYDAYDEPITQGALEYWTNEVESLKSDSAALNEFYRQFPRTEAHAFRDESKSSLFNLTKIYQQTDYNDSIGLHQYVSKGRFIWENGIKDTKVVWVPDQNGRFLTSWIPPAHMRNKVIERNGIKMPGNEHIGAFGCDSYDISGTVDGRGSNGSLHGLTMFNMDDAPSNEFFLEYIARPQTAEMFFEDVLMALVFYGMPVLAENNKPRLLYHLKNRGYRRFSLNRPDKVLSNLSKTERELGGIPNTSEDVKQAHASAIESYIEKYVGIDADGVFRENDAMGTMPFQRTLEDWSRFDINNRTKYDASISSGLAIMATQKSLYTPQKQKNKISVTFARYNNGGKTSELLR